MALNRSRNCDDKSIERRTEIKIDTNAVGGTAYFYRVGVER